MSLLSVTETVEVIAMSRSSSRKVEPVTPDNSLTVGVSTAEIENIVAKAVSAATAVVREEFMKIVNDLRDRLESVEQRLAELESRPPTSTTTEVTVSAVQKESRQCAVVANDAAQYVRRNNIRIKGLKVGQNDDCRKVVSDFIRRSLHVHIEDDDIEAAHTLPARSVQPTAGIQQTVPMVIVRFLRRDIRDNVIRNRKLLKSTNISIIEDLTPLNMQVLNRARNSDLVEKSWTWNGHVWALLKSGKKVQIRPFQTIEEAQ